MPKRRNRLWIILGVAAILFVLAGLLWFKPGITPIFAQGGGESETKEFQEVEEKPDLTVMPASIASPEPDEEPNVDVPFSVEETDGPLEQAGPVEGAAWGANATSGEEIYPAGDRPPVTR